MNLAINKTNLSYSVGYVGEMLVMLFLKLRLYNIIKHRYRCCVGEIDLIAHKKNKLIFMEVKTSLFGKEIPISGFQCNSIINSAKYFLSLNPKFQNYLLSFDFCFLSLKTLPVYVKNAWLEQ